MTEATGTVAEADGDADGREAAPVTGTRVVLIDARSDRRGVMRQMFDHAGVDATVVAEADGQADALALVGQHHAGLAVIDFLPPVQDGLDTIGALRREFPDLAIVASSFITDPATRSSALEEGADAYLVKPVNARELLAAMPTKDSEKN